MTKETGGPAFPAKQVLDDEAAEVSEGMTLRDWFAGQALAGLWGDPVIIFSGDLPKAAGYCYRMADAMIAERSK